MKIILLGSSPAMMLQALVLSQKYEDIEIHESKKEIGGSWKSSNFFNLKNIETGTHIFAPWKNHLLYNESLKVLKKKLGLDLFLVKPTPERIVNRNIKKTELKKIKYYYVKGGANKIIKNIKHLIQKKKIKIYTNSKVNNIKFTNNNKKKLYTTKKVFLADQIYFPHYCDFNKNFLKKNNISQKKKLSIHLVLKFDNLRKFTKKFSYIQNSIFSKWTDRVSVLSKEILSTNTSLFCLRISDKGKKLYKRNSFHLAKIISDNLLEYLNFHKNKKKTKMKFKYFEYETAYRNENDLKRFKKFILKNDLKLVDTSEFMKYIAKNIESLKKLKNYA